MRGTLRLGTRGSRLALVQSEVVAARLRRLGVAVELVTVLTEGDRFGSGPAATSGPPLGEGVFVTALEQALTEGRIDLAVHSAKDVPLRTGDGLSVAAFPERADPRDALVTARGGSSLGRLPLGAAFGTDSPRRAGFILARRPDLRRLPLHGNVDTRLGKLDAGVVDVLVLAAAGLDRLGAGGRIDERLDPEMVTPAAAQGALAVQCRSEDAAVRGLLAGIDDPAVRLAVVTERRVLEATGGTCRAPVGALAHVDGGRLRLLAAAAAPDGSERRVVRLEGDASESTGARLAAAAAGELLPYLAASVVIET